MHNYVMKLVLKFFVIVRIRKKQKRGVGGGEHGIRTHDTLRYTRFPSVRLRPLGQFSVGVGLSQLFIMCKEIT